MKNGKRNLLLSVIIALVFSFGMPVLPGFSGVGTLQAEAAAKPTINKKKSNLKLGKTLTLNVKNASQKVKWSTSNKNVVRIIKTSGSKKQNAVIKGVKKGTATITAKIGSVKLKAIITVKHTHSYIYPATCTKPAKCECGATYGFALGHQMSGATCQHPSTCTRCGYVKGTAVDHLYVLGSCMWCNQLDLRSVVSFTLRNTSAQGAKNVRFVGMQIKNSGNSEFVIEGTGQIRPAAGSLPVTLYITDASDNTYLTATCFSRNSLVMFYDTMDNNIRFTFLPGGTLSFTAKYGNDRYQITMNMYGEYSFVRI